MASLELGEPGLDFFGALFMQSCPDWNLCSVPHYFIDPLLVNRHKKRDITLEQCQQITDCSFSNLKREADETVHKHGQHKSGHSQHFSYIIQSVERIVCPDTHACYFIQLYLFVCNCRYYKTHTYRSVWWPTKINTVALNNAHQLLLFVC